MRGGSSSAAASLIGGAGSGAAATSARVLYRNASLVDGRSAQVQRRISIFVSGGRIGWIRPSDSEGDPGPSDGMQMVLERMRPATMPAGGAGEESDGRALARPPAGDWMSTRSRLVGEETPIDVFGVGTKMGVPADAPYLDSVYNVVAYDERPVMKLSPAKITAPGAKQVFRRVEGPLDDVLGPRDETMPAGRERLLVPVMRGG